MRAIIYWRHRDGAGDVEDLKKFCEENQEIDIIDICGDAVGGNEPKPELENLLERAKRGEYEVLIIKSLSRLSRNMYEVLSIAQKFQDAGVTVFSNAEGLVMKAFADHETEKREIMARCAREEVDFLKHKRRRKQTAPFIPDAEDVRKVLGYEK